MSDATRIAQWSANLIGPLGDHFVISPGSRSTPLALAAAELAAADPRWKLHSVVDERSAAFFALGVSKSGHRPVLLCTSGSALAHYYPAILEAHRAGLPMVIVSSDRPPHLHDCGANQTVNQQSFFGKHVRGFFDVGEPSNNALAQVLALSMQARKLSEGESGFPGPVHINAPFAKPLEPTDEITEPPARFDRASTRAARLQEINVGEWPAKVKQAARPVVVAGPAHHRMHSQLRAHVLQRLNELCIPLLAERTSALANAETLPLGPLMLAQSARTDAELAPDLIIQVGNTPTSDAYGAWLGELPQSTERLVVAEHGIQDPWHTDPRRAASDAVMGDTLEILARLFDETQLRRPPVWLERWKGLSEQCARTVQDIRKGLKGSEALIPTALLKGLPKRCLLAVGNSLPIRLLEEWALGTRPDVQVVSRRGISGIDGWIATAAGVAQATKRPTAAWIGDIATLHDVGSLALLGRLTSPFVIIVANNRGGRIFEQLPISASERAEAHLPLWTTPHEFEFAHVARQFSLRYVRADLENLESCVRQSLAPSHSTTQPGAAILEVLLPARSAAEASTALHAALAAVST